MKKNIMKKTIISAMAIAMVISSAGCGSTGKNGVNSNADTNSEASAVSTNETNEITTDTESTNETNDIVTDTESTTDSDISDTIASTTEPVKIGNVRIITGGMEMYGDIKNKSFARAGQLIYNEVCDLASDDIDSYAKHFNVSGYFGTGILEAYSRTQKEEFNQTDSILYRYNPCEYMIHDYEKFVPTIDDLTEEQKEKLSEAFSEVSDETELDDSYIQIVNFFKGLANDSFVAEKLKSKNLTFFKEGTENFTPSDEDTIFVIPRDCERYNDTDLMRLHVILHTKNGDYGFEGYAWVTDDDEGAYIASSIKKTDDIGDEDEFITTYMKKLADAQIEKWKDNAPSFIYNMYFSSAICDALRDEGLDVHYSLNNLDENVERIVKRDFPQATSPEGITAKSDSTAVGDKYIIDMLKKHNLEGTLIIGFRSDIKGFLRSNDEFVQYLDEDGIIHTGSHKFENGKDGIEFGKYTEIKASTEE